MPRYLYYLLPPRNFANEYDVMKALPGSPGQKLLIALGYERITRREAESLCRRERDRRKYEPQSSGYAPTVILDAEEVGHYDR